MADNSNDDMIIAIGVDLATIRRGMKKLEQEIGSSTSKVQKQFDSLGRGIDNAMTSAMQNRINAMVGIGTKGAKEWTGALADQGKELERLRAKYSPLFATINNYKSAVADIRRAHAVGAISADEMTAAIQRERQAALASTAAIKGRNAALAAGGGRGGQGGAFNASNLAAQGFDTITTAPFMPWYTVALQQGPQVAAVFNDIKASGQSVGPAVAGAFAQIINPMSLVTIGVIAASAALIQYISSSKDVKSADDILKGHADTIALLKERYGEAAKGLRDYARESTQVAKADLDDRLKQARDFVNEQAKVTASFGPGLLTGFASTLKDMDPAIVRDLRVAFADLSASVARGEPDILRFREALSRIVNNEAVPESIRKMAEEYRKFDDETLKVAKSIPSMLEQLKLIEGVANGQTDAINKLAGALRDLNKIGVAPLTELQQAEKLWQDARRNATNREERDDADAAYRKAAERIANANPTINNADGKRVGVPTPGDKPSALDGDGKELKKAETAAEKLKRKYDDLVATARERNEELRLEIELIGQSGSATEAARNALELLQRAKRAGIEGDNLKVIEAEAETYRKLATTLAEVKLQQDLLNTARFNSLSKQDQQVVSTLRQYGLPEDLGGQNAQAIRKSLQNEEINSAIDDFSSSLANSIVSSGDDIGKAFGKTFLTALQESAQKQLTNLFSQLLMGLFSSSSLSGGGAAPFAANTTIGALLGAGAAPVGAVSRSALPAVGGSALGFVGNYKSGVDARLTDILQKASGSFPGYKVDAISGFRAGDPRFHGKGLATDVRLTDLASGKMLGNYQDAASFGTYERFAQTARGIQMRDYPELNDKFRWGGYFSGGKGKYGALDTMHFDVAGAGMGGGSWERGLTSAQRSLWPGAQSNGLEGASAAVNKLAKASGDATVNLGGFGNGLNAVTQSLGAGGGFDFSGLFSSSFKPNTTLSNFLSGIPGFATGTNSAPKGIALVGEKGPELVRFRGGEQVIPNNQISAPRAPRLAAANANRMVRNETSLTVQIQGASGDDHVRMLVNQGVQTALRDQNEHMRRQGFGNIQQAYTTDRG